ncbi:reverse transcriptase family protein [Variovorax paradoxus]|uniref:reverse transcriptase family protein n=1 Tax=Variovorax paradoxus TaxID=34073 RepID=UPI003D6572AE
MTFAAGVASESFLPARNHPLNQSPLYKVESRRKLATLLFSDLSNLQALANHQQDNYRNFNLVHADKNRSIELPKPALQRVHRRLFHLLDVLEKPDYLHSGRKQRSYITNARVHLGAVPLVKLDIEKFYASVSSARVYRFFSEVMRCSPDVAAVLSKLCTANDHLPIGSCASQLLAFFSAKPMFDELHRHSLKCGLRDSYYVDDLTWSGVEATRSFLWAAKQIVHHHGFKYHGARVYTADQAKVVTGVLISGNRLRVQRNRELELWNAVNALDWRSPSAALKAIDRLIGKSSANAQIDERFVQRTRQLRAQKLEMLSAQRFIETAQPPVSP